MTFPGVKRAWKVRVRIKSHKNIFNGLKKNFGWILLENVRMNASKNQNR